MEKLAEIRASELHHILSEVLPHVSRDKTGPYNVVQLETNGPYLLAVGSDPFTLAVSRAESIGASGTVGCVVVQEQFAHALPLDSVRQLFKVAKTAVRDAEWRSVIISNDDGKVRFDFTTGESLVINPADSMLPNWKRLIPDAARLTERSVLDFNPTRLARFTKVQGDHVMRMHVTGSDRSPRLAVVQIGSHFIGLIMECWLGELIDYSKPEWVG